MRISLSAALYSQVCRCFSEQCCFNSVVLFVCIVYSHLEHLQYTRKLFFVIEDYNLVLNLCNMLIFHVFNTWNLIFVLFGRKLANVVYFPCVVCIIVDALK